MRSILKHPHLSDLQRHQQCVEPLPFATCATVQVSPRVHFPPTPTLTSIFITHSSSVYDRTPAEVLPNACALPGRHEREIIDTSYPRRARHARNPDMNDPYGSYFYPCGSEACSAELSESDDSDVVRTPPEPASSGHPFAVRIEYRNMSDAMSPYPPPPDAIESALLFLPHASDVPSKTKQGTRRSHGVGRTHPKEPRRESADGRIQPPSDFSVPTLDFEGCLGGF